GRSSSDNPNLGAQSASSSAPFLVGTESAVNEIGPFKSASTIAVEGALTMRWEGLTSDRFAEAVKECEGVALVILSVVERHGHHLPLGTDTYIGREVARRATEIEPAIVFPDYIFTQIPEARHLAGTIAIDGDLMVR